MPAGAKKQPEDAINTSSSVWTQILAHNPVPWIPIAFGFVQAGSRAPLPNTSTALYAHLSFLVFYRLLAASKTDSLLLGSRPYMVGRGYFDSIEVMVKEMERQHVVDRYKVSKLRALDESYRCDEPQLWFEARPSCDLHHFNESPPSVNPPSEVAPELAHSPEASWQNHFTNPTGPDVCLLQLRWLPPRPMKTDQGDKGPTTRQDNTNVVQLSEHA
ncbi:hypothetical protein BGZ61DRAFT_557577 [Ilyonectria robusta]|uniref:uncharacterized protein n=1 Tax=Ilyonectria robusta TaxID=1079257 RepID=UPI001E8CA356|nr:uncharacterized protein BGZ61DRAFT_557577 [Ilyonectria robusta]KAH8669253.1 hypothetical protein BGZ61DRAFT_557577 [Ilyonectria robusta]